MVGVRLVGVTKKFGNVIAVKNLSLDIKDKECMVLLGPSGCGKSTILRLISGLERPTEGHIYIGEKMVNFIHPKDRNVAMVFQSYALYPHMNVFNNIAFGIRQRGFSKKEINEKVREAARFLGIEDLLERKPRELSGGQKQRVALARATVRDPTVFLLDEPLSNLDAKLRIHAREMLRKLQKSLGVTTIYVTHDQAEAMTIGDRIAVIKDGVLQMVSYPMDLYNHPRNIFVAGFVGSPPMNFIDCNTKKTGKGELLLDFGFKIMRVSKKGERKLKTSSSSELVAGVRPEDIYLTDKADKESIDAHVSSIEILGSLAHLHLDISGRDVVCEIKATTAARIKGKDVKVSFSKIHLFDKKTGERLGELVKDG